MVPLADGESEEEELLPSRRASIRFGFVFLPFYICFTCSICFTCKQGNHTCFICLNFAVFFTVFDWSQSFSNGFQHLIFNLSSLQGSASCIIQDEEPFQHSRAHKFMSKVFFHVIGVLKRANRHTIQLEIRSQALFHEISVLKKAICCKKLIAQFHLRNILCTQCPWSRMLGRIVF